MKTVFLVAAIVFITTFVVSIPIFGSYYAHTHRNAMLNSNLKVDFGICPRLGTNCGTFGPLPQSVYYNELQQLVGLEDSRMFYGRFVDRHLMPIPYIRAIGTLAFSLAAFL
jgi:hypothetical protein